ncbi:MAG TPA: Lrp/AsnC ligand binding domain-containing protein [Candidatus Nitrosotalea sp.]|nr:Lrp/AsnC ligand binding domain-containing protein [Candidatus Nitrosotalea sp.]
MTKAFVAIHCETGKESQIIKKLLEVPGIKGVTGVLGLYDIIVEIESPDSTILEKIITGNIRKVPNVLSTMTLITV